MKTLGIAGNIAKSFIQSKLTLLILMTSLLLGVFAILVTPSEKDPQIKVPMFDITVFYPGASAEEVEHWITRPLENEVWGIKGIDHVYSIIKPGYDLTIARFKVGQSDKKSLIKLYSKLFSHKHLFPKGASAPLIKLRTIYSIPILSITFWSRNPQYSDDELRKIAVSVADKIKRMKKVSSISIIGGEKQELFVKLHPSLLAAFHLSPFQIYKTLKNDNFLFPTGELTNWNKKYSIYSGNNLKNPEQIKNLIIKTEQEEPVYLKDAAQIQYSFPKPTHYVFMGFGPEAQIENLHPQNPYALYPAVTLAVAKKKGDNAAAAADKILKKIKAMKGNLIPNQVSATVTRNYGKSAKAKSDSLLGDILIAAVSVTALIAVALGWRESIVVGVAIPVTIGFTLFMIYLYGYTLNRVTLFALVLAIGILVDDAIVVVENIHRHFQLHQADPLTTVFAVDEVGNPTILATLTVIAALMPMAFVSGLMGPYMRPSPVGASTAMFFSLFVAFIVTPWISYKLLKNVKPKEETHAAQGGFYKAYKKIMSPLLNIPILRRLTIAAVFFLFISSFLLIPFKKVIFKMLPFNNDNSIEILVNMPAGTALDKTASAASAIGKYLSSNPDVVDYQIYDGTSAPIDFNGLVRHYNLRQESNQADIEVNLLPKQDRSLESHQLAERLRIAVDKIARPYGAKIKIVETPPGPPVLSPLVAEIYGPHLKQRIKIAKKIKRIFKQTPGVVDVDWYVDHPRKKLIFQLNETKAALNHIHAKEVSLTLGMLLQGERVGFLHSHYTPLNPVPIILKMPYQKRASLGFLKEVQMISPSGKEVPLSEFIRIQKKEASQTLYHQDLKPVTYVIGNVAGKQDSPLYSIFKMWNPISRIKTPGGYFLKQNLTQEPSGKRYAVKWGGEWTVTYKTFLSMGIAFGITLILIYILIVAWFKDYLVPLVIMTPIPLTLIGILPGHWLFHAFFTATSMMGFIALSGIIVRNSILLIDFVHQEWLKCGQLKDSLIEAGAVRFRPILLTALALVVTSFPMISDPIFQGLAVSLLFGSISATALTLLAAPLIYYELFKYRDCPLKTSEQSFKGGMES